MLGANKPLQYFFGYVKIKPREIMNLPVEFLENMEHMLGQDFDKYIFSMSAPAKRGLRVNSNYTSAKDFRKIFPFEMKNIIDTENYFELKTNEKLGNTVFHHAGMIYLQEPSSMLAALALEVHDGESVLDLCAAPGGKSSQILERNKTGVVVLNEISHARANILRQNVERQGFKNALITSLAPSELSKFFAGYFDKILVDAPCSGEGMFRKEPETVSEWNAALPAFNHERQMEILKSADKMLKTGGILVYSTCTFNEQEDERTVSEFAREFGYEILELEENIKNVTTPAKDYEGQNTSRARKCFPFSDFGEGQFVCKMQKISDNNFDEYFKQKPQKLQNKDIKLANDLLKSTISRENLRFSVRDNKVFISEIELPHLPYGVICVGVQLGEIKKDRIEPHHQFFKAYGKEFKNKLDLNLDDPRVAKYLKGEEIECSGVKNGYVAVLCCGVPVGGGKVSQGRVKNYYPKGLRV